MTVQVSDIPTLSDKYLGAHMKGFCRPECQGVRMAHCALQLSVSHDLCLGRQRSHRSGLPQTRASASPSLVLGIYGTEKYFEAIIIRSFHNRRQGKSCPLVGSWLAFKSVGIKHLNTRGNQAARISLFGCTCVKHSPLKCTFLWQGLF